MRKNFLILILFLVLSSVSVFGWSDSDLILGFNETRGTVHITGLFDTYNTGDPIAWNVSSNNISFKGLARVDIYGVENRPANRGILFLSLCADISCNLTLANSTTVNSSDWTSVSYKSFNFTNAYPLNNSAQYWIRMYELINIAGGSTWINDYQTGSTFSGFAIDKGQWFYVNISNASNVTVSAINQWDLSSISSFNITLFNNSVSYNLSTNTSILSTPLLQNNTGLWNITFRSNNYFNRTYLNVNVSTNPQGSLFQSQINFSLKEFDNNVSLSNFSLNISGYGIACNTTNSSCIIFPNNGSYNFSVIDNSGVDVWTLVNNSFSVNNLDNKSVTAFVTEHFINVTAKNILNNISINNFSVHLTDLTDGSDIRDFNVTNGSLFIPVIHHTYNISVDANNFSLFNNSNVIIINSSTSANSVFNTTFYLYTSNSFRLNFYNSANLNLLNNVNISLNIISDMFSNNYSISNGTLYIDLLTPTTYTLRFKSLPDFPERFYVTTLLDRSTEFLNLYLINTTPSSVETITITLVDSSNDAYLNSFVEVLRYDIISNSYLLQEVLTTDVEGKVYFTGELNTEFYKFIVEKPFGTIVYSSEPQYLRSNILTLRITTQSLYAENYFLTNGIYNNLTFNNVTNNFRYEYNDQLNNIEGAKLEVYSVDNFGSLSLLNTTITSTPDGVILINVDNSTGSKYIAKGYVLVGGNYFFMVEEHKEFVLVMDSSTKNYRLWLIMIVTIALVMLTIGIDKTLALLVTPLPLLMGTYSGFVELDFGRTLATGFLLITLIIAYYTNKKG